MAEAVSEKKLRYTEYVRREAGLRHHTNNEDMYQYELLRMGDPRAVEEGKRMFSSDLTGHVSDDPVRNYRYLFVASVTLASRSAIAGGMDDSRAYDISDLFIQKMDTLQTVDEIMALHTEMLAFYTKEMAALERAEVFSKPVLLCMDYICNHLHEPLRTGALADMLGLSRSYLSTLFRKETGKPVSEYILSKRTETAENMLRFSDFSCAEIAATLSFSSQSHFNRVFRARTGCTPREYRNRFFGAAETVLPHGEETAAEDAEK